MGFFAANPVPPELESAIPQPAITELLQYLRQQLALNIAKRDIQEMRDGGRDLEVGEARDFALGLNAGPCGNKDGLHEWDGVGIAVRSDLFCVRYEVAGVASAEGVAVGGVEQQVGSLIGLGRCRPAFLCCLVGSQRGPDDGLTCEE